MTQIFTGSGLGLHGSSLGQLGSYGPKGIAGLGQSGGSMYVNAANGNLVLKQSDGFLADAGVGLELFQTYNSRDANAWRFNTDTRLAFEGRANAPDSCVIRTDEDGHQRRFIYDVNQNTYLPDDGSTARLSFDGTSWNYREGSSQTTCCYSTTGQLSSIKDRDGHLLRFSYTGSQLSTITDNNNKQSITWSFSGGLLRELSCVSEGQTVHHVRYEYDAQHRLNRMVRDVGNGKTSWTAYDYVGHSNLISDIRQFDGIHVHVDYDKEGRIQRFIDGEGRATTYEYLAGKTIVTNGLGEQWTYYYDADARLTGMDGPDHFHMSYHYEGKHLDSITQGNQRWQFNYNDAGDCVRLESPSGEVTLRTFDCEHRLLSETHYQAFDNHHQPITPHTSHVIYDDQGHLRFQIAADGVVTEHRYDENGYRISSRCYLQARWQEQTPSLNGLTRWVQLQNPQEISLVDYHYDWRGCLNQDIHYTHIDEQGNGIATNDTIRTYSRFDAAGRLIETSNGIRTTHYLYDALGRLIKTIDNQQNTQTFDYDDAHQRIIKTDANGLQTISTYDKSGLLLSTQRLDATHDYGTITYRYDAAGQLISETDVTGLTRHLFYDALGRLQATVSIAGHVTEYRFDDEGHCIETHEYQQSVDTNHITTFAAIKPASTKQDRIRQTVYNQYHQIAYLMDADGAVIGYQYDAAGRISSKTAFAHRLTDIDTKPTPSVDDRTITYYYDANGRLQADINGEGCATEYRYDAQGHLTEQIRYKNKITSQPTGEWALDAPLAAKHRDIHTYSLFNAAGLKTADIDGEGYLTEYVYDARGLLVETIRYYTQLNAPFETKTPVTHTNDHHTTYRYNDLNQRIEESTSTGLVITYTYNEQGLVTSETRTDRQTHDARSQHYRYDALGRVIQRLDAQGAALLAQHLSDIDTIWQQHSIQFAYDIAGKLISETNALNETTRYIYNDAGLLTYTLSPTGAVTENRYNAFQQVETTIRYGMFYSNNTNISLADIKQTMPYLANPTLDEVTHYEYNTLGLLISQRRTEGSTQRMTYNAFGELSQTAQHTSIAPDILTDYHYDRRGLLRFRTDDASGIHKTVEMEYDAFGRVVKAWDAQGGVSTYQFNQRGESIRIENQTHGITSTRYDAFGRILRSTDKTQVTYTYDDQNSTLMLERDGLDGSVITHFNAFGDKLSITNGQNQTTTYQYDASGQLIHVDAPEHSRIDYTYDAAGRLVFQQDAGGRIVRFTYDAEGHVLSKTCDPDGLNITSTYTYDATGRQLQVVDAGRCTQFSYDPEGHLIETRQDPDGLNLITRFCYNERGQLIREIRTNPQGADHVTAYTRDALGRCLTCTIDPDGLKLITAYAYDNHGNVISQTDANQNTTHYVYDASHRLRYQIDARGVVTEHNYDINGNEIQTTTYANPISFGGDHDEAAVAGLIQPNLSADQHHYFVFDTQSRLIRSCNGTGDATDYRYDANDRLVARTQHGALNMPSRTTYFAYDGLNHERFRMDPNGHVTEFRYDEAGLLIQQTRFAKRLTAGIVSDVSMDVFQAHILLDPELDQSIYYRYDKAGRLTVQASAAGVVTAYEYDAAGHQTATYQRAIRLSKDQLNDANWPAWVQSAADDRISRTVYDAAGRATHRISASGHVIERRYDGVGNVVSELLAQTHLKQFAYDAAGRLLSQIDAEQHTTRYTYDQNNNVTSKTDAREAQWLYRYNATNQLIETLSPVTTFNTYTNGTWRLETRSVITQNDYDSFGNRIREIRDAGGMNQTIQYTYDSNNRTLQTLYPNSTIDHASQRASNERQEKTQTLSETSVYNAFGDIIEYRDKAGVRRYFVYDAAGQQIEAVNGEGVVTHVQYDAFGNVCIKTTEDRHEYYAYDEDNHLIEIRKDPIRSYNPRTGANYTASPTTRFSYNAFGDVISQAVQLSDTDWAVTSHVYDNDGLKIRTLDAEHYLTTYRYNAFGLLAEETQYAERGDSPLPSVNDRQVRFLYNGNGQLTQKTLIQVSVQRLIGNGLQYETVTCDLCSTYTYDAVGNMVSTTDAEGNTAYAYYNAQGKLTATAGIALPVGRAATTYAYDALGQLVETHQWAHGAQHADGAQLTLNNASQQDIIERDIYDARGQVSMKIDGTGHLTQYSYDANGNIARCWHVLDKGLVSDKRYTYDRENRLTQTATLNATGVLATDDVQYNAFGEIIKKGLDGQLTILVDYDTAGRARQSNTQGYTQLFMYDLSDHVTQVLTAPNDAEYDMNINGSYAHLQRHNNTYDALGRLLTQSREPNTLITQTQTVDRWGNLLSHTNALGYTTRYEYNALNALIEQTLPEATAVDEHGVARTIRPVNRYAIDMMGRTIAMTDANGHTVSHVFDAEGRMIMDMDARGNHRDKVYNLLGQMVAQINERGGVTTYTYDNNHRLLTVTTLQTAQRYTYDGAGQVISQADAMGHTQQLTYDELGHLTEKTTQNGTTRYEYDTAGHKTAEQDANGNTSTWRYDAQGHVQDYTDLGGHHTVFTYNSNGLVLSERSSAGKDIRYQYTSDGQISHYEDNARHEIVDYVYDAAGNITSKSSERAGTWSKETERYEYDAAGRLTRVKRMKPEENNRSIVSVDYEYDAVGNIRDTNINVNYSSSISQTNYFCYDENNRVTINNGKLVGGQITIKDTLQGSLLAYDETGNVSEKQSYAAFDLYSKRFYLMRAFKYMYNTDNMLEIIHVDHHDIQTKRYHAGLLTEETFYDGSGKASQFNKMMYVHGRLEHTYTYNANMSPTSEMQYVYDNMDNLIVTSYRGTNYGQRHDYSYELWDGYRQKTDDVTFAIDKAATTYGKSSYSYDMNGLLDAVVDTPTQANSTRYIASNLDGVRQRKNSRDGEINYLTIAGKTMGELQVYSVRDQRLTLYGIGSPETQQDNLGTHTLQAGDTLESIALQVYGDSSLWYLIADANGITNRSSTAGEKGSQLHVGTCINIPSMVKGQHNTSETHKVMSSTDWTGNISATAATPPAPPPKKNHHSFWKTIAKITVVVTASIVMVMSAGALATIALGTSLSGASLGGLISTGLAALGGTSGLGAASTMAIGFAAGFSSSIAGQTAANILHQQNGMDVKGALLSGLGTAATAGLSHFLSGSKAYADLSHAIQHSSPSAFNLVNASEMMERDAVTQSLNLALNKHQHFDFLELGVSSATAGIMGGSTAQELSQQLQENVGRASAFVTSELQALATGAATGHFDALQILQDNLGNAASASLLQQPLIPKETEEGGYCPIPRESDDYAAESEDSPLARLQREQALRKEMDKAMAKFKAEVVESKDLGVFNPEGALTESKLFDLNKHNGKNKMLGSLSMKYETGRDESEYLLAAGTVSNGQKDDGGISYGAYQLSSMKKQVQQFLQYEGKIWASQFDGLDSTRSGAFGVKWKAIAEKQGVLFFNAQHAYIERTHYRPVINYLQKFTGLDINTQSAAVQNAVWSASVQHGRAKYFLVDAINSVHGIDRSSVKYAPALLNAIYSKRNEYVSSLNIPNKESLLKVRYPDELQRALKMLKNH